MLKIGCCGFAGARARYYRHFPVVEVQQTFYQPPRLETLERWRGEAPPDFEFALKAWQVVTHPASSPTYRRLREPVGGPREVGFFRPSDAVFAAWQRTREAAAALDAGLVLFQCPASFTPTAEHIADMRAFFRKAPRDDLAFVWEPRGKWANPLIAKLCNELGLIHCVDPYKRKPASGGLAYFRLHGITGYRYRYTSEDLHRLREWCAGLEDAYCLFNNMTMFEDAKRFQAIVGPAPRGRRAKA